MAFSKWYPGGFKDLPDKSTPVSAAALNNIEDGLVDHESRITDLEGGDGGGPAGPVEWDDVDNKPSTFPPDPHTHEISDVTGLQAALDGKQAAGSYAPATHTHTVSDVTGLQTTLDGKASATHTHAQSDVTGLSSALAGKVALRNNSDVMVASTDTLGTFTVESDGTSTSGWPNRLAWLYKPLGGIAKLVQWVNEYGELRITPARNNTVGFRVFAASDPTDYASRNATVPVMEVSSDRTDRNNLFGVYSDGALTINGRRVTVGPTPPGSPSSGDLHILTES